jgi:hypothetical protein
MQFWIKLGHSFQYKTTYGHLIKLGITIAGLSKTIAGKGNAATG